jgi:hypothetical protein
MVAGGSWITNFATQVDTIERTISTTGSPATVMAGLSYYSGTDNQFPVPVKLMGLLARKVNKDVFVTWQTSNEINSSRFEVQRHAGALAEAEAWEVIGNVKAKGNSASISNYQFIDDLYARPAAGLKQATMHYRLKMIDKDGKYDYSKVVTLNPEKVTDDVNTTIYPNPFSGRVYVSILSDREETATLQVTDISGKVIINDRKQLICGNNCFEIESIGNFGKGIYFLSVMTAGKREVVKIIAQ